MKVTDEASLLSLGIDLGRAASIDEAYSILVERLESTLGCRCAVRAQNGTDWRTLTSPERELSFTDQAARVPLTHREGATELIIEHSTIPPLGTLESEDDKLRAAVSALLGDPGRREALGAYCSAALELVSLRAQRAEAKRCADLVDRFSRLLLRVSEADTLYAVVVEHFARAVGADIGALAVFMPLENSLAITATRGYPAVLVEHVRIAPGEGVIGRVFSGGEPILVAHAGVASGQAPRRRYRTDSYVALPLAGPDGVVAVVSLTDKAGDEPFTDADLELLTTLSIPAALAVSREILRSRTNDLAHLATVDPLTGLFNRRYFETRLEQEIQRQRRQFDELSLLMVDLDNFKQLNDTFGHLVGDVALREVAEILHRAVRIFDVCARFGGEEFVILMPGAGPSTALRIAERIRRQVEQHFTAGRRPGVPATLTVSIGVATATPTVSSEALIAGADAAMLRAKVTGKNQVNLHTAP